MFGDLKDDLKACLKFDLQIESAFISNDPVYVSFAYSIYFSFQEVSYVLFDYRMCRDMSTFIFHPFQHQIIFGAGNRLLISIDQLILIDSWSIF